MNLSGTHLLALLDLPPEYKAKKTSVTTLTAACYGGSVMAVTNPELPTLWFDTMTGKWKRLHSVSSDDSL